MLCFSETFAEFQGRAGCLTPSEMLCDRIHFCAAHRKFSWHCKGVRLGTPPRAHRQSLVVSCMSRACSLADDHLEALLGAKKLKDVQILLRQLLPKLLDHHCTAPGKGHWAACNCTTFAAQP